MIPNTILKAVAARMREMSGTPGQTLADLEPVTGPICPSDHYLLTSIAADLLALKQAWFGAS